MNQTLTGTALTLHNLALAANFGGSLYGKAALHPAVKTIGDTKERGEVLHKAWNGFNIVNALSLGAVALTWLTGRSMLSGGEIDDSTRALVIAKDVLVGVFTVSGIGAIAVGAGKLGKDMPPVESGGQPAPETPSDDAKALQTVNTLGTISLICGAGIIALTAILNVKAERSLSWKGLSKLLP